MVQNRHWVRSTPGGAMPHNKHRKAKNPFLKIALSLLLLLPIIVLLNKAFIESDTNGSYKLSEWRTDKLVKELNQLNEAEQYVLRAKRSGTFDCFSCTKKSTIFLMAGQVYKYGITTKGVKGRYAGTLKRKGLVYHVEFTGTIEQCLKKEKIKIYHYALLPENLARPIPLIRPPGNHRDN